MLGPRIRFYSILFSVAGVIVGWQLFAKPWMEYVMANNTFLARREPAAGAAANSSRYYTKLFELESGKKDEANPSLAPEVGAFLQRHQWQWRPIAADISATVPAADLLTVKMDDIVAAIGTTDVGERIQRLQRMRNDVKYNLTVLQSIQPAPDAQEAHQHYLAATLLLHTTLQQLDRTASDPIGGLLAATWLDELNRVFTSWHEAGSDTFFVSADTPHLALETAATLTNYPVDTLRASIEGAQVAGVTSEDACWLCIPMEEILTSNATSL